MDDGPFPTNVPARLDRLRWSSFHSSLIAALGTSWIIDGLEVTLVGSLGSVLTLPTALGLTPVGPVVMPAKAYPRLWSDKKKGVDTGLRR